MIKVYYGYSKEDLSTKAHELLDSILKENNINEKILKTKNGKPYIKDNPIYFNISHSHEMYAVVISDSNVGLDLEYIPNLKYNLDHKTYIKWLSDKELADFDKEDDKLLYLAKRWVIKESYIKLNDIKLTINNLKEIDIKGNFKIIDNYVINVLGSKEEKEEYICIAKNVETN